MKRCPKCGYELPDAARFCMGCGNALLENNTRSCPECGFEGLPKEAMFCPNCGKELSSNQVPVHEPQPKSPQEKLLSPFPKPGIKERDGLHVGDYFYDDGTTSSELIPSKKVVGVVFSLETTDEEKHHGWTHGHIFAVSGIKIKVVRKYPIFGERFEMSLDLHWTRGVPNAEQIFPGSGQRSLSEVLTDRNGYIYTNHPKTNDSKYEVFTAVRSYNQICPLPKFITSEWYLPAIGQLYELLVNFGNAPINAITTKPNSRHQGQEMLVFSGLRKDFIALMNKYGHNTFSGAHYIASSSECGKYSCWQLTSLPFDSYTDMYIQTFTKHHVPLLQVLPVAAF